MKLSSANPLSLVESKICHLEKGLEILWSYFPCCLENDSFSYYVIMHTMTLHQTDISGGFVWCKVLNMLQTSHLMRRTSPDNAKQGAESPDKKGT